MLKVIITGLFYFFGSIYLIKFLIPYLKKYFLDNPNKRSSHKLATPSGAGIVFVIAAILSTTHTYLFAPIICLPIAIVGFVDDNRGLSPIIRIFFQLTTIFILILKSSFLPYFISLGPTLCFLTFVIIILIGGLFINFFNFFDGLDGLLATCMSILLISANFYLKFDYLPLTLSLFAFLFMNWNPAKVFMGDGGSTFLGAIFVSILLGTGDFIKSFSILLVALPLLCDCGTCMLRRFREGHKIYKPHKLHLFQRLQQAGWTHSQVTLIYGSSILILALNLFFGNFLSLFSFSLLSIIIGCYLDKFKAIPFEYLSLQYKK